MMLRLAEDYKRRRKSSRPKSGSSRKPPPKKRVSEKGSLGRAQVLTQGRPLAPQPRTSDGTVGSGRPPEGQPSPALAQQEQSPASLASPTLLEPQFLPPQHWGDGVPSGPQLHPIPEGGINTVPPPVFNPQFIAPEGRPSDANQTLPPENWNSGLLDGPQSYPLPEGTGNAAPPPVPHPQTITPTGRRSSDKDTDWMDLDFLISGKRQTFHGLYTRLEYHSTVSPRLARLSKHGIQPRPPAAGPGTQAIMRMCIPVCIPNVSRGCREKDVVMVVDGFLGKADFCVGMGVLDKITAVETGIDLNVGLGPASSSTVDLTPVERMSKCLLFTSISLVFVSKLLILSLLRHPGADIELQRAPRHDPRSRHGRDCTPARVDPTNRGPDLVSPQHVVPVSYERRRRRPRQPRGNICSNTGIRT